MREKNRNPIASIKKLPQFTTMNVIDGQAGLVNYSSLIFYSLTIDNILNIIVLLILAGISIATITSDNGLIKNAGKAKEQAEIAEEKEILDRASLQAIGSNKTGNLVEDELQNELDKITNKGKTEVSDTGEEFEVVFTDSNRYYTVDKDGNVEGVYEIIKDKYPGDITVGKDGETLDGSEEHPYEIWCIEDLCAFSKNVNSGEKYSDKVIKLMTTLNFKSNLSYSDTQSKYIYDDTKEAYVIDENSDKTLKEIITDENSIGFVPIGVYIYNNKCFMGIFDGNNNSINNIFQNQERNLGLFGGARNATIKNLTVTGNITSINSSVGGICATTMNTQIINCHNKANIIQNGFVSGNNPFTGGIVGQSVENGEIINCSNMGNIKGEGQTGGIAGTNEGSVINCYNLGNVTGGLGVNYGAVGGIVGCNSGSLIYNCFNIGEITSNNTNNGVYASAGGILGSSGQTGTNCKIVNSYNLGKINYATKGYGAIVGGLWYGNLANTAILKNTYYQEDGELLGYGGFASAQGVEKQTSEYMHSEKLVTALNNYIESNTDGIDTTQWKKWKLGENGYPIFESGILDITNE